MADGIDVTFDLDYLSDQVATKVAQQLADKFPEDTAEFWGALCDQAYQERERVAAMLDLTCPERDRCPYRSHVLADISSEGDAHGQPGD